MLMKGMKVKADDEVNSRTAHGSSLLSNAFVRIHADSSSWAHGMVSYLMFGRSGRQVTNLLVG